jgi:hypothetical protein
MPESIACKSLYCSLRWAAEATEKNDGSKSLYCSLRWVTPLDLTISLSLYCSLRWATPLDWATNRGHVR